MDQLLNPLSDPMLWSGVSAESAAHEDQRIAYHASTALRFTQQKNLAVCSAAIPSGNKGHILAFNMSSRNYPCELYRNGIPTYRLWVGDSYFTFSVSKALSRVTLPITGSGTIKLESLHHGKDYVVISDLRIIKPEFPADLLAGVKTGIERHIHSWIEVGSVTVRAGDKTIGFSNTWEWLAENLIIRLGERRYQIKNHTDNTATLGYTYDGDTIIEDFSGTAIIEIPVEIGFYDWEALLPGIVLWYQAPAPRERHAPFELLWCVKDDTEAFMERNPSVEAWTIYMYIAAHSPELVAVASKAVRAFLAEYTIWCCGNKLWFNWIEPPSDTDPTEVIDTVQASLYRFEVEVEEDLWQPRKVNLGASNLKVYPRLH